MSWVLYVKFRIEEHSLVKLFAFLKNVCYQYFYFVPFFVLFCFVLCFLRATDWPTTSFLGMYFFSCNGIDQLCLGGPGCSSHTIKTTSKCLDVRWNTVWIQYTVLRVHTNNLCSIVWLHSLQESNPGWSWQQWI